MSSSPAVPRATALRGALVGAAATVPMSALMAASVGAGVMPDQPPRRIIGELLPGLDGPTVHVLAAVSHALYGAGAGATFAQLPLPRTGGALAGAGFGLLLWAAGYEGWVPLLGTLPPGHRDHRGRVVTMVAAHLAFGAVLGRFVHR